MTYFTKDYTKFLKDLSKNNEREWFHANKKRYEEHVKKPFEAFVQKLIDEVQKLDPAVVITPKDAIFRIYRDTRFSKDKTPYKTQMSAVISAGGRKDHSKPGIYIEASHEHFSIYSGMYSPDKNQLQLLREAIVSRPKEFAKLLKGKKFVEVFGAIHGEKNKRIPKEFREAAEQQPLIFNKQFYIFAKYGADQLLDPKLPKFVLSHYRTARPLSEFFQTALSPSR